MMGQFQCFRPKHELFSLRDLNHILVLQVPSNSSTSPFAWKHIKAMPKESKRKKCSLPFHWLGNFCFSVQLCSFGYHILPSFPTQFLCFVLQLYSGGHVVCKLLCYMLQCLIPWSPESWLQFLSVTVMQTVRTRVLTCLSLEHLFYVSFVMRCKNSCGICRVV